MSTEVAYPTRGDIPAFADSQQATAFTCDPLDRLTGASGEYSAACTYDVIGNLLTKTEGGIGHTLAHTLTRPVHAPGAVNGQPYTYDANGNTVARPGQVLAWDGENRLASVTQDGITYAYTYDGDGNRVKVTVGNVVTAYVGSTYEVNPGSGVTTTYYYLGSQRVAMRTAAGVTWLAGDHLGSTSLATNAAGQKVSDERYLPYGGTRLGSAPTDYQFTGQRKDGGTGLYYYGARYYDPATGRFISADTIVPSPGNPQALNRYSYVYNNPVRYTDPGGQYVFEEEPDDPYLAPPSEGEPAQRSWTLPPYASSESTLTALGLLGLFVSGLGDETQRLTPKNSLTQDVMFDPGILAFMAAWGDAGYPVPWSYKHRADQRTGPPETFLGRLGAGVAVYALENSQGMQAALNLVSGIEDVDPSSSADMVGAILGSLDTVYVTQGTPARVRIRVVNDMGLLSGTRIPGTERSLLGDHSRSQFGPCGTTTQMFSWWLRYPPSR